MLKDLPHGLLVASTEALLQLPRDENYILKPEAEDAITLLSLRSPVALGEQHGVCKVEPRTGEIQNILYRRPRQTLVENGAVFKEDGEEYVLLYSGTIFVSADVTETLLNLNATPPLDLCTYLGVDNGGTPILFELYKDILLCLATETTREEYISMDTFDRHPESVKR